MSRPRKGASPEGKVPTAKEGAAEASDFARDLVLMMEIMTMNKMMLKGCR